jgi:outer membrane protein assembly factor BamE (lipoprotein component of BamABCDE complex)
MTQEELQDISSKKLGIVMTPTKDKFCTFDAHSYDYVVEFKCRRTHYDTQLIEYKKYKANLDETNSKTLR